MKQPAGLISVLLDKHAEFGDRDDAGMDLEFYDTPESISALLEIVEDPHADEDLRDTCKESLQGIYRNRAKANI